MNGRQQERRRSIKVSSAMVSEGFRVYEELKETYDGQSMVVAVYSAMKLAGRLESSRAKAGKDRCEAPNACSDD